MSLNITDIKRIAHLARLEISEQEANQTLTKLTGILGLIEQMQAVDTAGITPMSHSQDVVQRLREDEVTSRRGGPRDDAIPRPWKKDVPFFLYGDPTAPYLPW